MSDTGFARRVVLFVLAAALTAFPAAVAQDAQETRRQETVVVTATADPVPLRNLGRALVVLDRSAIERTAARSVADVLRQVASVEVRARGPRGVQSDFQLRGAGFGQALVMVDGVRINDAQSGHHNGDIPVPLDDVERIEVLLGPGSSLHGADAFGGVIHVITRRNRPGLLLRAAAGSFGTWSGAARLAGGKDGLRGALTLDAEGSDGFVPDRDHRGTNVRGELGLGARTTLTLAHLDREFGAAGFYGAAPSREWTAQTLTSLESGLERWGWEGTASVFYRTHRDRFLFDRTRPLLSDNRHRTHAAGLAAKAHRRSGPATRWSVGVDLGHDAIRSNNLGRRSFSRGSGFVELQRAVGGSTFVYPGLRLDAYERFGSALSPSLAVASQVAPGLKLRAAAGRAFRVPTFTELYYRDPNHEASDALEAERAWSVEAGADWSGPGGVAVAATGFLRREDGVIDWVRETPLVRWRTTNVREARTRGLELSARRPLGGHASASLGYTWLDTRAETLDLLSKYVLDFARHSLAGTASLGPISGFTAGARADWKRRADGRSYWLLDLRLERRFGRLGVYVEGTNLLDTRYEEIRGVDMPGRAALLGLELRAR